MKSVTLYRPLTIEKALRDFDRYMGSFFDESPMGHSGRNFNRLPAVDIRVIENAYLLEMELPGFDEEHIQIQVNGRNLTIASRDEKDVTKDAKESGKGQENFTDENGSYLVRERGNVSFSRSFTLPEDADMDSISAALNDGLLRLEIKKRQEAQKRFIEIGKK